MKRTVAALLALIVCLSLCACGASAPAPEPTPEPTPNPAEVLYAKYSDVIDALEAEDYDAAAEAVMARKPVPPVTAVEITLDNFWDYFEIAEEESVGRDAHGEIFERYIHYDLSLKKGFTLADRNEYPTDIAVSYEYDLEWKAYDRIKSVDFYAFTCDGRVIQTDRSQKSYTEHFGGSSFQVFSDSVFYANGSATIVNHQNFVVLNASGTLYLAN